MLPKYYLVLTVVSSLLGFKTQFPIPHSKKKDLFRVLTCTNKKGSSSSFGEKNNRNINPLKTFHLPSYAMISLLVHDFTSRFFRYKKCFNDNSCRGQLTEARGKTGLTVFLVPLEQ